MRREVVKYSDGVVFTRLLDSYGDVVLEIRGRLTLKQLLNHYRRVA